jgi:type IV secretory pathway VirD2 relaxase
MTRGDGTAVGVRTAPLAETGGSRVKTFLAQILSGTQRRERIELGAGRVAAAVTHALLDRARRVSIRTRVVPHGAQAPRSSTLAAHLAYLQWPGAAGVGRPARIFDARTDAADAQAFAQRGRSDRHHFRFLVAPDDAGAMADLHAYARDLMADMEYHLDHQLDWIAVDHWVSEAPHLHVLVRGRTDEGRDFMLGREWVARVMRPRAEELATAELGLRSDFEVRSGLERSIDADRWTELDTAIRHLGDGAGMVTLGNAIGGRDAFIERLMTARLERLGRMLFASQIGSCRWMMAAEAEAALRDFASHNDIIRGMHRALRMHGAARAVTDFAIHDHAPPPVIGRLIMKGLHDELNEEGYAVIDAVDGGVHYVRFPDIAALEDPPLAAIVAVCRSGEDHGGPGLVVCSDLPLEAQVGAIGATWLDRQLAGPERADFAEDGFGRDVREAMAARIDLLASDGLAGSDGRGVASLRDLLATLRQREIGAAVAEVTRSMGLRHRPVSDGGLVTGVYRRRCDLASGRFAVIVDGEAFDLVPWQTALDGHRGRRVEGVMQGESVDWTFGRRRVSTQKEAPRLSGEIVAVPQRA